MSIQHNVYVVRWLLTIGCGDYFSSIYFLLCYHVIRKEEEEGESVLGEIAVFTKIMKTRLWRQVFASAERGTISYHKLDSHCCCWRGQTKEEAHCGRQSFSLKTDREEWYYFSRIWLWLGLHSNRGHQAYQTYAKPPWTYAALRATNDNSYLFSCGGK